MALSGLRRSHRFIFFIVCIIILTPLAFHSTEELPPPASAPYLTVFLIDGLSRSVFERLLGQGHFPEIAELISQGAYVQRGVTCLPSMTGYCYYPLMTGLEASRSGVTGMRWFDRSVPAGNFINYFGGGTLRFLNSHIGDPASPTLFEAVVSDGWTASAGANYNRGANVSVESFLAMGLAKIKKDWWVSRWFLSLPILRNWFAPSFPRAEDVAFETMTRQLSGRPKVHWCTFGSPDSSMHVLGLAPEYEEALRHVDTLIGRYRRMSTALGTETQRVYAVLTDHGAVDVSKNIDLGEVLAHTGLRAYRGFSAATDKTLSRPVEELADVDVCVMVNGDTLTHLYFRHPDYAHEKGWYHRVDAALLSRFPTTVAAAHDLQPHAVDVVSVLLKTAGVELVVLWEIETRRVVVHHSEGGVAHIAMNQKGAFAFVLHSADPLRYHRCSASKLVTYIGAEPRFHAASVWLDSSSDCEFPYGVVRLYQLMSAPKSSDIVVTSLAGYDLGKDFEKYIGNFRGGHGGPRYDQLSVPYIISGPGVKAGSIVKTARAEDIGATLLHLLTGGGVTPARAPTDPVDPLSAADVDAGLWRGAVLRSVLSEH